MTKPTPIAQSNAEFVFRTKKPFILKKFIYNSEEHSVLGRTGKSWFKFFLFYAVFYGVLIDLVAIQIWLFSRTLDAKFPKRILYDSIIGGNPGMGFRPQPPDDFVKGSLIWLREGNTEQLIYSIDDFLEAYKIPYYYVGSGANMYNCKYNQPAPPDAICDVDIKNFGPCTHEYKYGYHKYSPCIFLKLNKIYGWIPDFYKSYTDLPENMPTELRNYIKDVEELDSQKLNTVWISCEGKTEADAENIGPISYFPRRGFPGYYYPYQNAEGYLSPLVAIQFERPQRGVHINVECKAWAHNIYHYSKENLGSVSFQLLID